MFSRKSMVIATVFIAFMYLVFVPIVYAATEYKMTDYWPLKEGSWWEFNDGKIEITGTEKINEINTFIYIDSGSCESGKKNVVSDDTNGYGVFFPSKDGGYSLVKMIEPYVKKGDKTKASFKNNEGYQGTLVFKFEGTANVVVPAGKFKRCLRFSVKLETRDTDGTYSYYTEKFYLAKGVGLVKGVRVKESANSDGNIFAPCGFDVFNGIRKLKDYSSTATGTYTASGTYTWNSTKGKITWNWTTTDFVCEGPDLGTETKKGVTVTSTTMTWPEDGNDNNDMTWSRSSGTSGDIVGTWTSSDSETGNSWTLTFNADGTVSGTGNIVKCGDDGGGGSPIAQVVNNSGDSIYQVNVGSVTFSENLSYCSDGCSTGFSDVAEGANTITVKQTSTSASVSVGSLGSFQRGNSYAVNIRTVNGSYCAELWQRLNTAPFFNNDTTRVLISTTCGGSSSGNTTLTIPTAIITVDGNTTDWNGISALATDPQGDSSTSYTGDDIKEFYAAEDTNNLYLRLDLWENVNTNFWNFPAPNDGSYRLMINTNDSSGGFELGVAYNVTSSKWELGYNGSNSSAFSGLTGAQYVGVSGSVIEVKVPLSMIGSSTAINGFLLRSLSVATDPVTELDTLSVSVSGDN